MPLSAGLLIDLKLFMDGIVAQHAVCSELPLGDRHRISAVGDPPHRRLLGPGTSKAHVSVEMCAEGRGRGRALRRGVVLWRVGRGGRGWDACPSAHNRRPLPPWRWAGGRRASGKG